MNTSMIDPIALHNTANIIALLDGLTVIAVYLGAVYLAGKVIQIAGGLIIQRYRR